jgi:hypothetical protein
MPRMVETSSVEQVRPLKTWQLVVLTYLTTAVIAAYLASIGSSPETDAFVALGITLAGLFLIRRLRHPRNPNT